MPNVSYAQSNFQAGEWSPEYQGRIDDKEYAAGLALCLNYIPNQEASLTPRGGLRRIGNTKFNAWAKLWPFRFSASDPYIAEHTSRNLRLWSNGRPILSLAWAQLVSQSGTPPTFVVQDASFVGTGFVPLTWATGDSILVNVGQISGGYADVEAAPFLCNREFILTVVDQATGQITLRDAITGSSLPAITGLTVAYFYKILDLATPYNFPQGVRQIQFADQTVTYDTETQSSIFGPEDQRVTWLYPLASPRSLSRRQAYIDEGTVKADFQIQKEQFIDGPYLDSQSTNEPMTVSGTSGAITVRIHGFSTVTIYRLGQCVWDGSNYFVSLKNGNVGHALPVSSPFVNADWAILRDWSSGDTYALGNVVEAAPFDAVTGVGTVYYSLINANLAHSPASSPLDWSTTAPTWDVGTTYATGACVIDTAVLYICNGTPTVGTAPSLDPTNWVTADFPTAFDLVNNLQTGWPSQLKFFNGDVAGDSAGADLGNNSRLFRMKVSPQPWDNTFTYAKNDLVNYNDDLWQSQTDSNTGNIPDQDATNWAITAKTIQWTWGAITGRTDDYTAEVTIKGAPLGSSNPVYEWRFGVFSDTTGWPTCGAYHEGRIWLAGLNANRLDGGVPNQGYNFTPTAPDGTVADNNAISYTLNSRETETIQSVQSIEGALIAFTSESEWQVMASSLNDPLTPTSIQAHRTTNYSSAPSEVIALPTSLCLIQNGGRRMLEYRSFLDIASYQARMNAIDLTKRCQHLTSGGILSHAYQSLPQPIIWFASGGQVGPAILLSQNGTSPPNTDIGLVQFASLNKGNLGGMAYMRSPDNQYYAPFSFEHGKTYSGADQQYINSIAVQRGAKFTDENLYVTVVGSDSHVYMEMMEAPFDNSFPATTFNTDGTVKTFGTIATSFMLDGGVQPTGCKLASNGSGATFYGLMPHAGATVSFTIMGKYIGDYLIGADGSVTVAFTTGLTKTDIGHAMEVTPQNALFTLPYYQSFHLDKNGITGVQEPAILAGRFYGQFGYAYRRRGQMLRPAVNGANGPAFAKTRRNHKFAIYVVNANEVSIGDSFDDLRALPLTVTEVTNTTSLTNADFVTGVYRDDVESDHDFDGGVCWEQTKPVPGGVLAVGGFLAIEDV